MPAPRPLKITLSEQQRSLLEQIVRRHNSPQGLVQRAQVILSAAKNINNTQIAQQLQLARNTVRIWRQRWLAVADRLMTLEAEGISDKELAQLLVSSLADAPRSGTPATFTTEQVVQIVALACETPHNCGSPVSHWTTPELAQQAVKRGIVNRISHRSVGRFLKRGYPTTPSPSLLVKR
jgi:putative transposase